LQPSAQRRSCIGDDNGAMRDAGLAGIANTRKTGNNAVRLCSLADAQETSGTGH
jgi:hypothetical protein